MGVKAGGEAAENKVNTGMRALKERPKRVDP
jgi:hypothetical protein